jgi:hypothetical protein
LHATAPFATFAAEQDLKAILIRRHRRKSLVRRRPNHADPGLSVHSDRCFDMAADWLFHNQPV